MNRRVAGQEGAPEAEVLLDSWTAARQLQRRLLLMLHLPLHDHLRCQPDHAAGGAGRAVIFSISTSCALPCRDALKESSDRARHRHGNLLTGAADGSVFAVYSEHAARGDFP